MLPTQTDKAGEPETQSRPIKWVDDASRISNLFCRHDAANQTLSVHHPLGDIMIERIDSQIMDPCGLVGLALAGQPLGETGAIIQGLNLQS